MRQALCVLALILLTSCASTRLGWLDPLPVGEPFVGPAGSYSLTPPSSRWVRVVENEGEARIDLSLARNSNDAWLNVSLLPERFATAELALAHVRAQADALMSVVSRDERDVAIPSPGGDLAGRLGRYCGTFDREIHSRDNCFVMLTAVWQETSYVLVGQVRVRESEPARQQEFERLILSLRLLSSGGDQRDPADD